MFNLTEDLLLFGSADLLVSEELKVGPLLLVSLSRQSATIAESVNDVRSAQTACELMTDQSTIHTAD